MSQGLLPCPFCGSEAEILSSNNGLDGYYVACCVCDGQMGDAEDRWSDPSYAVGEWNERYSDYPEPDWSTAPEWAQWWAVQPDTTAWWFGDEPTYDWGESQTWWMDGPSATADMDTAGWAHLPLGCDWRLTKRQRPEAGSNG